MVTPGLAQSSAPTPQNLSGLLFDVRAVYADLLDRQRAGALMVMCWVFGGLGFLGTLALLVLLDTPPRWGLFAANLILSGLYFGMYGMARRGRLRTASFGFILIALAVPTIQIIGGARILPAEIFVLAYSIPAISAALLVGPAWSFVAAAVSILLRAGTVIEEADRLGRDLRTELLSTDMLGTAFLLIMLAFFSWLLARSLYQWAFSAQRRARQLEAAALVSETAAIAPNLQILLNEVVNRIREAYAFYHAQVFLVDQEGRMARLEASTGRAGEALLARGHALPVGSRSVIGQCTYTGKPVVVNDVRADPTHRPNELLPDTRGELSLPLLVRNQVIGALDVQSNQVNAFQPDDVRSLQLMANQIASAIEKTRLLNELESRANENQHLYEEAQKNLQQIEELNRRLTREGWTEYLRLRKSRSALGFTLQDTAVQRDAGWTAAMRQAYQGEQTVIIRQDQDVHIAAVPLRVRGEVIGVLEIERGGNQPWKEDDIELAQMLVDRLALAVENARLFEQASEAADREHIVNEIAQEVQAAGSIDEVLQVALSELSSVLGVRRGMVQINPKTEEA